MFSQILPAGNTEVIRANITRGLECSGNAALGTLSRFFFGGLRVEFLGGIVVSETPWRRLPGFRPTVGRFYVKWSYLDLETLGGHLLGALGSLKRVCSVGKGLFRSFAVILNM